MGLAWQLYSSETSHVGAPWAFKNGGTAGSSTDTVIAPSERTGVTTMFNKERVDSDQIAVPILRLLIEDSRRILPATGSAAPEVVVVLGAVALLVIGGMLAAGRRRRRGAKAAARRVGRTYAR